MSWDETRPSEEFRRLLAPDGTLEGERPGLDDDELVGLYRTMRLARRFDERATSLQRRGEISIHSSSVGEEAIPVGSAAALEAGDWCFHTYRQTAAPLYWGAPLARAVASLMGAEPETVDEHLPVDEESAPAVNFPPVYIPLAANVPNAVGSAMADRFGNGDAVSLSYVGDGSTSQGDFYEALNVAGVFEAPAVTICHNNQWAISVPTHRQTAAETFARKAEAAGVPHERVDGNDVLAVYEVTRRAVERARAGEGPSFVECVTYRRGDHNTADAAEAYRDDEEREYWAERDPIDRLEAFLESEGVLDDDRREAIGGEIEEQIAEAIERARDVPDSDPERMFDSHLSGESWTERRQRAELHAEREGRNPFTDVDVGREAEAGGGDENGIERGAAELAAAIDGDADSSEANLVTAVRDALAGELRRDESVRLLGYDVGPIGGVFRATEGLHEEFGPDRVIDTPLAESALLGSAVGMAMRGQRPIAEIQFMGFLYPAFGQFMYTLAKLHERSGGSIDLPVTVRIPYGGGIESSEYHSESTEAFLVHTPGVRVVCPSTPAEAKGLLVASIRSDDPVVLLEPKRLYRSEKGEVPDEPYALPIDEARLVREGGDVTVLAWGAMVREAVAAAEEVDADVEVLDLRTLSPLPVEAILASVKRTGRCVVLHEARRTLGLGAELSALLNEHALAYLEAPVVRATGYDVHFPGHQIEGAYLPDAERAANAIRATMEHGFGADRDGH